MRLPILALATLALAGCATGYTDATNPFALTGGYYDSVGPAKLTTVGFAGNGFTDAETARRYVLRRAAEVTQEQGKSHFLVYTSLEHAARGLPAGEDLGVHSLGGKPFQDIYILTLAQQEPGALIAADVLARVTAPEAK